MKGTTGFAADLGCRCAPLTICAKQGDEDSREVKISFLFNGEPFDLIDAERTEIRVQKPDGTITVNDGELYEDYAVYPLSYQSLTVSGEGKADFILYGSGGEVISSVPARLKITGAPVGDEAVVSTNEYRAFFEDFEELEALAAALAARLGGLSFVKTDAAAYAELETDENTLYIVTGERDMTLYLGDIPLKGSGSVNVRNRVYQSAVTSAVVERNES